MRSEGEIKGSKPATRALLTNSYSCVEGFLRMAWERGSADRPLAVVAAMLADMVACVWRRRRDLRVEQRASGSYLLS